MTNIIIDIKFDTTNVSPLKFNSMYRRSLISKVNLILMFFFVSQL